MRYKAETMPDSVRRLLPPEAKKELGLAGLTMSELIERQEIKSEKQLQNQIAAYLRLRNIPFIWHRTDRKTTCGLGVEDFACCVPESLLGIGLYVALEAKFGDGEPSPEQMLRRTSVEAAGGIYRVVRTLAEVKACLDDITQGTK